MLLRPTSPSFQRRLLIHMAGDYSTTEHHPPVLPLFITMLPSLGSLRRTSNLFTDQDGDLTSTLQLKASCSKSSTISSAPTTQPPTPLTVYVSIRITHCQHPV
ncbi:hypothetical protein MRX96_020841 [Rhipicephalus microplus]